MLSIRFLKCKMLAGDELQLTLDFQVISSECPKCSGIHPVVRGSVYDGDTPIGIYLISLHGHYEAGRFAHLAIAVTTTVEAKPHPIAVALNILEMKEQVGFQITDWSESIFSSETYLGEMLDRCTALTSSHIDLFFHIAEHVVGDLPDVKAYFS
jgi:hypothetical protein